MIILSHRGLWRSEKEKNTETAFRRSFDLGYGTETDIRDYCGELVISHDIADNKCISLRTFFEIYKSYSVDLPLALNIKADGLQKKLLAELNYYQISNYFVFDMSVPDGIVCVREGLKTFTRQSEFEPTPAFYELAQGVWLDEFIDHWVDTATISNHLKNGKQVCIVSPDLHRRPAQKEWQHYYEIHRELGAEEQIMICTDYAEEAARIINEN
jgi:hypothetical protein